MTYENDLPTSGADTGNQTMSKDRLKLLPAACFTVVFILLVASSFYFLYHAPVMGVQTSWNEQAKAWQVIAAEPSCPLKKGDLLLQLGDLRLGFHHLLTDNIYIAGRSEIFAWLEAKKAVYHALDRSDVQLRVMRKGQAIQIEVPVHKAGFSFLNGIESLHLLVGTAFFIIGLMVFRKKGFEEVSLVFCLMCMALAVIFITNAASLMSEIVYDPDFFSLMNLINIPGPTATGAFMLHFSLLMPVKRGFLSRYPRIIVPLYALCAAAALSLSLEVMNILFPVLFIGALAFMVQGYIRYKDPILRQQMRWVVSGFVFGLLPFVLINALPLLIMGERLINDTIPGLFLIFIPLFMAFAIQRTRLMDIDTLYDNTLIYAATFGVLTVMDVTLVSAFAHLLPEAYKTYGTPLIILSLWLAVILYMPVRNRFQVWIKRMLKRELYDLNEVSTRLSSSLISAPDVPAVFDKTMEVIDETLHPLGASSGLIRGTTPVFPDAGDGLPAGLWALAPGMTCSRHLYEVFGPGDLPPDYSAGVLVPIPGQGGSAGFILLKNKHSGRMYGRDDLRLLDMAARLAGLAIESIRSREAMQRKEKETQAVREHISREIHDGIGSNFSNAIMMLDLLSNEISGTSGENRRIRDMKDLLSEGLSEMRGLIMTLEEQDSTLEDLADLVHDKTDRLLSGKGIKYGLHRDIKDCNLPLNPLVMHHVLRIVQEALTNALKHSGASEVLVRILEEGGVLTLSVTDNGRGFDTKGGKASGYGLRNMRRRCSEIGADLSITSVPGKGASVSLVLSVGPDAPLTASGG